MLFPLVTPEIVMGVSLLLIFTEVFTFIPTGTPAQILGHVTFSISYVVVIVRGRLFSIGKQYEEAAADLGASPPVALTRVLLPLLMPAIIASAAVVFAISLDDFVISQWLSSGGGTNTVPIADLRRDARRPASVNERDRDDHDAVHAPLARACLPRVARLHSTGAARARAREARVRRPSRFRDLTWLGVRSNCVELRKDSPRSPPSTAST